MAQSFQVAGKGDFSPFLDFHRFPTPANLPHSPFPIPSKGGMGKMGKVWAPHFP